MAAALTDAAAAIDAVLLQCLPHRHDVFGRHIGLDVVYRRGDKAAVGAKVIDPPSHFFTHLGGRGIGEDMLCIYQTAPEGDLLAEVTLERR